MRFSLPGAFGMYGLSVGISNVSETLPRIAYALLSGLNAATVGVIALAAVELSEKAITDDTTRLLVFFTASAGMLYNALWYFPVLVVGSGAATILFDYRVFHPAVKAVVGLIDKVKGKKGRQGEATEEEGIETEMQTQMRRQQRRSSAGSRSPGEQLAEEEAEAATSTTATENGDEARIIPPDRQLNMSWKVGLVILASFFLSFTIVMILRSVLHGPPLLYRLFSNMYLAGTIIFGGGPVVIPLLREYIVAEGWVSARDFLIGLALIQAFPGPNFNFAVYLGSLVASNGGFSSAAGAVIAYVGIFLPGMWLVHGTLGVWSAIRGLRYVRAAVRGMNAAAVGLIYTAVYRLWQIGYIDEGYRQGTSLAVEPWWVVVTAASFVGGRWFKLKAWTVILMGAVMGLIWYGIVTT